MSSLKLFTLIMLLAFINSIHAQKNNAITVTPENSTVHNRDVDFKDNIIHLNAKENDGILWLDKIDFKNGTIELDIKGEDLRGKSFVGIAFHAKDNDIFDGIYFRPFNFESPERKTHSVQYISMPDNDWSVLRKAFPDKYENTVNPVPNPNDWFHAKIEVKFPKVKVYINGSSKPSLEIEQISDRKKGKFGLWVGYGSEGWFKNISLNPNK
jgi:hypothetical protein